MIIKVKQSDIEEGFGSSNTKCPVARALRRTEEFADAEVFSGWIESNGYSYELPPIAREFIQLFDSGALYQCDPIEFEVGDILGRRKLAKVMAGE